MFCLVLVSVLKDLSINMGQIVLYFKFQLLGHPFATFGVCHQDSMTVDTTGLTTQSGLAKKKKKSSRYGFTPTATQAFRWYVVCVYFCRFQYAALSARHASNHVTQHITPVRESTSSGVGFGSVSLIWYKAVTSRVHQNSDGPCCHVWKRCYCLHELLSAALPPPPTPMENMTALQPHKEKHCTKYTKQDWNLKDLFFSVY